MATIEEIAATLERQLSEANAKIDEFVSLQSAMLGKAAAEHDQVMRDMEGKMTRILGEEESAASRVAALRDQLESENLTLSERNAEIAQLEAATRSMPVEVDAARAAEAAARVHLLQQQKEYDAREERVRFTLNELTKGVAYYKRLGLDFDRIHDDKLRLSFTLIDPRAPDRAFAFNVKVSDSDTYHVDSCEPPIAGLEGLVADLNASNDFSAFVQTMRRKFKELCTR